jgi:mannitol-1-phosphate 5-dehydrogenase
MPEQKGPLAVHFGAGNIGRGFIGALLQDAGYFVVFADVHQPLIDSMKALGEYRVRELDGMQETHHYKNFTALNSISDQAQLLDYIAQADIVTASVGAAVLSRIAPVIEAGLKLRKRPEKLVVMACENALRASEQIRESFSDEQLAYERAVFCNTAVDRIVPLQPSGSEPDVAVESFSEWVIDISPLGDRHFEIAGAKTVGDLEPYIERKLFTVNTAHLAAAYLGQQAGHTTIVGALNDPVVRSSTDAALLETSQVLIRKHALDADEHAQYVKKTMLRISNPAVDDEIVRVGRDPIRKLSKSERLIGPAAYFATHIGRPDALLRVIDSALSFSSPEDPAAIHMQQSLATLSAQEFALEICGITRSDALSPMLEDVIEFHKSALASGQLPV